MGTAYRILNDGKDRKAWLEARANTLGASEAPSVCGVGRFGSPLSVYMDKVEGAEPFDNPIMRFGRIFEEQIARDYAKATGRRVVLDGRLMASKKRPWQSCTLDAIQWRSDRPDPGLLEVKTSLYGWDKSGLPIDYRTQIAHQFAVTGFAWGTSAMFNRTTCELVHTEVDRDEELIQRVTSREHRFWHHNVMAGVAPTVENDDDTESTKKALLRMFPQHREGESIALGADMMEARDRLLLAKSLIAENTSDKKAAENQIKQAMGTAEIGAFADGSGFTLRTDARGNRILRYKENI